jgi:Nif-specific regulatory protein
MEFVQGIPFDDFFHRFHPSLYHVAVRILQVLDYIHSQGMVHGDLKPSNVFVIPQASHVRRCLDMEESSSRHLEIKLLDFGFASTQSDHLSALRRGTIGYSAPELFTGQNVDGRADIFSLGVMLYEAVTGEKAFKGGSPAEVVREVVSKSLPSVREKNPAASGEFDRIVSKMVAKEPFKRFFSAREGWKTLSVFLEQDEPVFHEMDAARNNEELQVLPSGTFVNREKELRQLHDAFSHLKEGRETIVFVTGEEGIGKTAFVHRSRVQLEIGEGECATFTFDCATDSLIDIHTTFAHEVKPDEGTVDIALLNGQNRYDLFERITHNLLKILKIGKSKHAFVIVENFDFADDFTASFWQYFSGTVINVPVLVVFTLVNRIHAERITSTRTTLERVLHIDLSPLTPPDVELLIRSIIGPSPRIKELSSWIGRVASGNPMFILDVLQHLANRGLLISGESCWEVVVQDFSDLDTPTHLKSAILSRVDALPETEKHMLRAGAIIGEEFDGFLLEGLTSLKTDMIHRMLWRLTRQQILVKRIRKRGVWYAFRNHILREAILDRCDAATRAELHQKTGEILEGKLDKEQDQEKKDALVVAIAEHFSRGTRKQAGFTYYRNAAEIFQNYYDYRNARTFLEIALSLTNETVEDKKSTNAEEQVGECRFDLLKRTIKVLNSLGERDRAIHHIREALNAERLKRDEIIRLHGDLAGQLAASGKTGEALREVELINAELELCPEADRSSLIADLGAQLAWILYITGHLDQAEAFCRNSIAVLNAGGNSRGLTGIYHMLSAVLLQKGDFEGARQYCKEEERLARRSENLLALATSYSQSGMIARAEGKLDEASACFLKYLNAAGKTAEIEHQIIARYNLGAVAEENGDSEGALEQYLTALPVAEKLSHRDQLRRLHAAVGALYLNVNDWQKAEAHFEASIALCRKDDETLEMSNPLNNLSLLLIWKGEHDRAYRLIEEALYNSSRGMEGFDRGIVQLNLAEYHRSRLETETALNECRKGIVYLEKAGDTLQLCKGLGTLAEIHGDLHMWGELERCIEKIRTLMPSLKEGRNSFLNGLLSLLQAKLAAAGNENEQVAQLYGKTLTIFRELNDAYHTGRSLMEWGSWEIGRYRGGEGDESLLKLAFIHLDEGASIFSKLGAKPDLERTHTILGRVTESAVNRRMYSMKNYLEPLTKITRLIASTPQRENLLEMILTVSIDLLQAERGILFLRNEFTGRLFKAAAHMIDSMTLTDARRISSHILNQVTEHGKPVTCDDAQNHPEFSSYRSISFNRILSLICVPLKTGDRLLGALYVDSRLTKRLFTTEDRDFLVVLANLLVSVLENSELYMKLQTRNRELHSTIIDHIGLEEIIGESPAMQSVFDLVRKSSQTDCTILFEGETGTGKELFAQAVHYRSSRARERFMKIDCGALPETVLESELFGHCRGAFTGAIHDKIGLFEEAHGGTIFLDEIGDAPASVQAGLLRVVESGEIRRVGEVKYKRVDVRILAASNTDLVDQVKSGVFRSDLFFRLGAMTIHIPPLRKRGRDIVLLANHFLKFYQEKLNKRVTGFSKEVMHAFRRYGWPGNVRELKNIIERAMIVTEGSLILLNDVNMKIPGSVAPESDFTVRDSRDLATKSQIVDVLRKYNGKVGKSADMLGFSQRHLYRLMKRYSIDRKQFRS